MRQLGKSLLLLLLAAGSSLAASAPLPPHQKLTPVPFNAVTVAQFWAPRLETNHDITVRHCLDQCVQTGRISNFAKAAGLVPGDFQGAYFNDSDVYKVIEGAAYALTLRPDADLQKKTEGVVALIKAAQGRDGYLNSYYTLQEPDKRWTDCKIKHELYCAGHLIEAAVAYYHATGDDTLLGVAIRFADYIDSVFGPDKNQAATGHQEIELALVKLYRLTGNQRYFKLAQFFLDQRGGSPARPSWGEHFQDHLPVTRQTHAVGHAVRACYLYTAMADVAMVTGDIQYLDALDKIWHDIVDKKLYITGGVGSEHQGENFPKQPYVLPNDSAYCETCASIANVFFNHRLNLIHADARYVDVLERTLYNALLAGIALDGKNFFYVNPLVGTGQYHRSPWFGCACCPSNVVRFIPTIGGYAYAHNQDEIYVNLYLAGQAEFHFKNQTIKLTQHTAYPWDGKIKITLTLEKHADFTLQLRIPGWARNKPVPGDLYAFNKHSDETVSLTVNAQPIEDLKTVNGYLPLKRKWQNGDQIDLVLPMPVRLVKSHPHVKGNQDLLALQRGPLVYCLEEIDNPQTLEYLYLDPEQCSFTADLNEDLLGGVTLIKGQARLRPKDADQPTPCTFTAVPYYAWDNRQPGRMKVYLPTRPDQVQQGR